MKKLDWCLKQKKGIRIIEPNDNLCKQYLKSAEENLNTMNKISGKWRLITAYYACYEGLYALLQKIGIKCEIHDCTLELLNSIEGFDNKLKEFITNLKRERIDTQYYLKAPKQIDEKKVKEFVTMCKSKIFSITEDEINLVRSKIKKL
tara:strand:+ start:3801 stop:4244 length:444 start_codon:yes stop_codon:yes gene_type:complete